MGKVWRKYVLGWTVGTPLLLFALQLPWKGKSYYSKTNQGIVIGYLQGSFLKSSGSFQSFFPSPGRSGALMDSPRISVPSSHTLCRSPALNYFHVCLISVPLLPTWLLSFYFLPWTWWVAGRSLLSNSRGSSSCSFFFNILQWDLGIRHHQPSWSWTGIPSPTYLKGLSET